MKKAIAVVLCLIFAFSAASAHSGRTDANGGHWDRSTGEYHYHHGYPAHQHPGGVCPYNYNDLTGSSSGSSSGSTSSGSGSGSVAAAAAESDSAEDSSIEYKYNDGAGDDGTYETAYNLGYQHGMEAALSDAGSFPVDLSSRASELCAENAMSGQTLLSDVGETYDSAYEAGYLKAQADLSDYINKITTPGFTNPETGEFIAYEDVPALLDEYKRQADENYAIGYSEGQSLGYENGYDVGYNDGRITGTDNGYDTGYSSARTDFYWILALILLAAALAVCYLYLARRRDLQKYENLQKQFDELRNAYNKRS